MKRSIRIVIDTNVWVAALRSNRGASFELLRRLPLPNVTPLYLTVPLVMEHADVLGRPGMVPLSRDAVDDVLNYLCAIGTHQAVHFLWRPHLRDPGDDMVLEAAVNADADWIVTHNIADFAQAALTFKPQPITPRHFLRLIDGDTPWEP